MDQLIPDWAAHLLGDHYATFRTYSPYIWQFYSFTSTLRAYAFLLIDQVTRKPDLATIALLLVVIFVSLKILAILWSTIMFWVRLVRGVLFWGTLVVLAVWMWSRGPEGVVEDVNHWIGVWQGEKVRWAEQERRARALGQQHGQARMGMGGAGAGNRGWW